MDDFRHLRSRWPTLAAGALLVGMTGAWLVSRSVEDCKAGCDTRVSHSLVRVGVPLPSPAALDRTGAAPTDLEVRTPRFAAGVASRLPASRADAGHDDGVATGGFLKQPTVSLQILFCTLQV